MQDELTNGVATTQDVENRGPPSSVAVEVAAVPADEDAMDTTPDNSQSLVLPNGSADPQEVAGTTPSSPSPNAVVQEEAGNNGQPPAAAAHPVSVAFHLLFSHMH